MIKPRRCRPLFPEGYQNDTQIIATVFSADNAYDTDVLALTGASASLALSDIPFGFLFAGVRVGRVNGKLIANPTIRARGQRRRHLMAASRDAIFMVEGGASGDRRELMIDALLFGQKAIEAAGRAGRAGQGGRQGQAQSSKSPRSPRASPPRCARTRSRRSRPRT